MLERTEQLFGTGDPEIDDHHRELFDAINALMAACDRNAGHEEVDGLIAFLTGWVDVHFETEERLMAAVHCPVAAVNAAEHRQFREALAEIRSAHEREGSTPALAAQMQRWLVEWMTQHIQLVDRQLFGLT